MAGLAKFLPSPPKSCFTNTMAMKEPKMACQMGIPTFRLNDRIRPVTAADRSPMVFGFLQIFSKPHSKNRQDATQTASTTRARGPKMTTDAIRAGTRAISTSRMILDVLALSRM